MGTAFKQVKNNARSFALSGSLNNTTATLSFGVTGGTGSRFPQPGNGFYVTAYNASVYSDPSDDPNMRVGLCTARSGDTLTVTWGQLGTPINALSGQPVVALFIVDELINDIYEAINDLEDATSASNTEYNVLDYGAVGDGVTNDATAINNAITAANAAGGGTVFMPKGTYMCNTAIVPKSYVTLRGAGMDVTTLKRNSNNQTILLTNAAATRLTFKDFSIEGPVNEFPTTPRRTRTVSGPGASYGIYLTGDLDPNTPGAGEIKDVTLLRVKVKNCRELPIRLFGIKGDTKVIDCEFDNNKDPGFGFCNNVIWIGSNNRNSHDNGVSFSRGNKKGIVANCTFENCALEGVFAGGFDINGDGDLNNIGPTNFVISNVTIKGYGNNGVYMGGAPMRATVSDLTIDQGYYRGPSGSATVGVGVSLPAATITVSSGTLGWSPNGGSFTRSNGETITYTGITETTFTGCSGGTGTLAVDEVLTMPGTNINSTGVLISGWPPNDLTAPTEYADKILLGNLNISRCARNAVEIAGAARNVHIDGVLATDIGSQYAADGVTPIASNEVTSNVGVLIRSAGTPSNITVRNVDVIDTRGTPYTNYAIVPFSNIPTSYIYQHNNMINCRNSHNLRNYDVNAIYAMKGIEDFHANRVITITDNAASTPNFLNIQASEEGQLIAFSAENFTGNAAGMLFRSKGAAPVAMRPGSNTTTGIQFRNAASNIVASIDTSSDSGSNLGRLGINTTSPASALHVVGTTRSTDMLLTNPLPVSSGGTGQANLTSVPLTTPQITNGLNDSAGNRMITFTPTASAVTNLGIQNAATGGNLAIAVTSTDTNAGGTFRTKGNGTWVFRPETDTIIASQWRKADNTTVVVNVDTTNGRLGIGTAAPTRTLDVVGDIRAQRFLGSNAVVTTFTADNGAGTSPTLVCTGTDVAGKIVVTAGTTPATTADVLDIGFGVAYPNAPYVILTPGNTAAATLAGWYAGNVGTTGFSLTVGATALVNATQYIWYYHVIG